MLALACTPFAALNLPSLAQGRAPIGEFLELIFVAIFLLVPVIRGIFQGKKKEDLADPPKRTPGTGQGQDEPKRDKSHSREFWETILKGEAPPTAEERMQRQSADVYSSTTDDRDPTGAELEPFGPAGADPVTPVFSREASDSARAEAPRKKSSKKKRRKERPAPTRGSLVQLKGLEQRALSGPRSTPETQSTLPKAMPQDAYGGTDLGSGIGSGLGERLESHVGGLVGSDEEVRTAAPSGSGKRKAFDRPSGSREWRRAMVLSEIVAPPLALRDLDDGMGTPPGLR